jgi:hypothetical protein
MRKPLVVAALAAGSLGLLGGQADAVTLTPIEVTGQCIPAYLAVGVGNALTYEIFGVAVAAGSNTVATQIECKFVDTDAGIDLFVAKSGYVPGPAATLAAQTAFNTFPVFITCTRVDWIDVNDITHSTPWLASDGSYCG